MKKIFFLLFVVFPVSVFAQQKKEAGTPAYPQDYFRNPLDIPIFLAGNFGECRPGHFHSGVDIKTLGEENQPVHVAADGYISRIKMDKGGFGHALYVTHPNGYTTLYAHLNKFASAIQEYLDKEQYAKKHWDVDITLTPAQFPVKKGQQIAWSGNTGASTAPHLHFEIRDTKTEHPLNPELFGLPIVDKVPPLPAEVAVYDLSQSIYEQDPIIVSVKKKDGIYGLLQTDNEPRPAFPPAWLQNDTINTNNGLVGIGVNVDDHMEGSDNTIAFLTAELYMDDVLQSEIKLDDIGYDVSRYVNAYADYKTKEQHGKWIQCLFKLPGNHLNTIYPFLNEHSGGLDITDKNAHEIKIVITDDKGNTSKILFWVKPSNRFKPPVIIPPAAKFTVNDSNYFTNSSVKFSLDELELYDNFDFRFDTSKDPDAYSLHFKLHSSYVPVHHYFDLKIKPTRAVPADLESKVVMMYTDDKDEDGRAATQTDNGWYHAKVRNFGTYWLDIDTTAPVIKSLQKNGTNLSKAKQITFEVKDAMTSVKSFSGYLDGKWLCFEQHGNLFFYKFDGHCPKGKHALVFKAEDENGNEATTHLNFTR